MTQGANRAGVTAEEQAAAGTPTADPGGRLLRAGTLAALAAAVVVALVSVAWGPRAVVGALLGGLLATGALAVGPVLLRATRSASPPAVTAAAAGGYTAVVTVLGVAFALLAPAGWLSAEHLAAALVAVTVAGLAGQVRAVTRLRVPAFGHGASEQGRAPGGPGSGHGAQSPGRSGR